MLIVMDKSTQKEQSSQLFQTINKQIKVTITFLTAYIGFFLQLILTNCILQDQSKTLNSVTLNNHLALLKWKD